MPGKVEDMIAGINTGKLLTNWTLAALWWPMHLMSYCTPVSPKCRSPASLISKEVWPHDPTALWTSGSRFQSESGSSCVCWPTAASTALRLTTLLRLSDQSLAVEHVNTSDQPRRQLYWYHPRVVRLSVIGPSQWLPHGLGMLYHNTFGTRLLFPSSAKNWRPFCSGRRSLMRSDNVLCFICAPVAQCWSVTMYWLLQTDFVDIVRWSCSSLSLIHIWRCRRSYACRSRWSPYH